MFFVLVYAFLAHGHGRTHDAGARQVRVLDRRANHDKVARILHTTNDREFREPTLCVMPHMVPHRSNVYRFSLHVRHRGPNAAKAPQAPLLIMPAKLLLLTIDANSSLDGKVGHVPAAPFLRGSHVSQRSVPRSQSPRAAIHHEKQFPGRRLAPIRMQRFASPLDVAVAEP